MIAKPILQEIIESLVGDEEEFEMTRNFFKPVWIVESGHTRYSVNKAVERLKEDGLINYIASPWNGYEFTTKGLTWVKTHYAKWYE